jgi:hypothetical protein
MKRALHRRAVRLAHRALSALLALVFASSTVIGNAAFAFAAEEPDPQAVSSAAPSTSGASATTAAATASTATPPAETVDASPTVVRELEASCTVESSTYLMSDGEIAPEPIHYRDELGGWRDIDPSLVPSPQRTLCKELAVDNGWINLGYEYYRVYGARIGWNQYARGKSQSRWL